METGQKPAGGPQSARTMKRHLALYQPPVPSANRYLQHKWDKASFDQHREKVKSARSIIDITPPKIYSHLALGLKKQQLVEQRTLNIQSQNTILLNKIRLITRTGGIDNWNHYTRKSLGKERRQQEVLRIEKENQKILLQLNHCRSNYDVRSWQKDWRKHLKLKDSMARYPRGCTNLQKGQDKPMKKPSGCDKEQKNSEDETTHGTESNNAMGEVKPEENKEEKELEAAANPRAEIQQDTAANPTEHAPSSDDIQATDNTHTAETSPSPDGCAAEG